MANLAIYSEGVVNGYSCIFNGWDNVLNFSMDDWYINRLVDNSWNIPNFKDPLVYYFPIKLGI